MLTKGALEAIGKIELGVQMDFRVQYLEGRGKKQEWAEGGVNILQPKTWPAQQSSPGQELIDKRVLHWLTGGGRTLYSTQLLGDPGNADEVTLRWVAYRRGGSLLLRRG